MSEPIRTLIADDEPLARQRLRRLCEREGDVEIVAEACDGTSLTTLALEARPELLGVEIDADTPDGQQLERRARARGGVLRHRSIDSSSCVS